MTLDQLRPGESALIESVGGEGQSRRHFLDMGVIPGTPVTVNKLAPMGDPMQLELHGYELTLRLEAKAKGRSLTTILKGTTVTVLNVQGKWALVEYEGLAGYVEAKYLKE